MSGSRNTASGLPAAFARATERDLRQLLARGARLVEVALREQRAVAHVPGAVRQRDRPLSLDPVGSTDAHRSGSAHVHLRGGLPDRTEHEDVVGEASGDRHHRVHDAADLSGKLHTPCVPARVESEEADRLTDAGARQPGGRRGPARIGGHAVDVVGGEAHVADRGQCRVGGEHQRIAPQTAADLGDPDAADRAVLLESARHRGPLVSDPSAGRKIGMYTSRWCANSTSTSRSHRNSSSGQSIRFVIRCRSDCSSSSTVATT